MHWSWEKAFIFLNYSDTNSNAWDNVVNFQTLRSFDSFMIFTKLLKRCLLIGGNEEEANDNEIESWEEV